MRLVKLDDRLLVDALTGPMITRRRDGACPRVSWSVHSGTLNEVTGNDALAVIDAQDELLRQQDEELLSQRVGQADPLPVGCLEDSERGHPLPGRQVVSAGARIVH
ncbi:MAG: hypothetical protein IT429_14855 [Gemmataceae bacterium]|nr:hypothetical protein [Gemmataceae bacterium]